MGLLNNIARRLASYTGKKSFSVHPSFAASGLRPGMWVVSDRGNVGIANAVTGNGIVEVHYVDEAGHTVLVGHATVGELRQARYNEIPEKRRPPKQAAANLGYEE